MFKCESFAYNASSDVIQAEQMADAQLKALVQEWEGMLDSLKARVEDRVSEELNPMVYPQVGVHARVESVLGWRKFHVWLFVCVCRPRSPPEGALS